MEDSIVDEYMFNFKFTLQSIISNWVSIFETIMSSILKSKLLFEICPFLPALSSAPIATFKALITFCKSITRLFPEPRSCVTDFVGTQELRLSSNE